MPLGFDHPRSEDGLEERRRRVWVVALEGDVVDPRWHPHPRMKRIALIVNPFASAVDGDSTDRVERALSRAAKVETHRTKRPGHATELAREAAGTADAIVVFSGDGGFNEVLNGLPAGTPVGFIPGGGSSVLPRALGVSRDPEDAAAQIADAVGQGRARTISLGRVNGRRFGFSAGIGLDAELVRRVDARGRAGDGRRPRDALFAWTVLQLLAERRGRFDPALEIRGLGRAAFALVANTDPYTYLGPLPLHVAPDARFDAGLSLVAPTVVRPRTLPRLAGYAVAGRGHRGARDLIYAHDLDRIEIVCDVPMPLQADGEDLGDVQEAVFESERKSALVLV
jgi:diacylglycerol kinase family enzyme